MTQRETIENEIRKYFVSGSYQNDNGDVKFTTRDYHVHTSNEAVKAAGKDGLFGIISVKPEGEE